MRAMIAAVLCLLASTAGAQPAAPGTGAAPVPAFVRYVDRTQGAFTVLVPQGWRVRGGMFHLNALKYPSGLNTIETKMDFAVMSDTNGTVMIRWIPHYYYSDIRRYPAGRWFRGNMYHGMPIVSLMAPQDFCLRVVYPFVHRNENIQPRIIDRRDLPRLAAVFTRRYETQTAANIRAMLGYRYFAGMVTLAYVRNGVNLEEKIITVIEARGPGQFGTWKNPLTLVLRVPAGQWPTWAPVLDRILGSMRTNRKWLALYLAHVDARMRMHRNTQEYVRQRYEEILRHRRDTHAAIRFWMWWTMQGLPTP
jgi:hypothetical protein